MKKSNNLNEAKIIFKNSKFNYITSISFLTNEKEAKDYFIETFFNMGVYPNENMQKCIGIEFTDNNLK